MTDDFKTFQVYSSFLHKQQDLRFMIISKLFKFTVHLLSPSFLYVIIIISKLFKFTVHSSNTKRLFSNQKISKLFKFTVHNSCSVKHLAPSLISKLFKFTVHAEDLKEYALAESYFKTFQVYSSLAKENKLLEEKGVNFKTFQVYSSF